MHFVINELPHFIGNKIRLEGRTIISNCKMSLRVIAGTVSGSCPIQIRSEKYSLRS